MEQNLPNKAWEVLCKSEQLIDSGIGRKGLIYGDVLYKKSYLLFMQGSQQEAVHLLKQCLSVVEAEDENCEQRGSLLHDICSVLNSMGAWDEVLPYSSAYIRFMEQKNDTLNNDYLEMLVWQAYQLGNKNDLAGALLLLQKAYNSFEVLNDTINVSFIDCLSSLAMTYNAIGDFRTAKGYAVRVLSICEQLGLEENERTAVCYMIIGKASRVIDQSVDEGLRYSMKAYELFQIYGNDLGFKLENLNNLSDLYFSSNQKTESQRYAKEALDLIRENRELFPDSTFTFALGRYLCKLDYIKDADTIKPLFDEFIQTASLWDCSRSSSMAFLIKNLAPVYLLEGNSQAMLELIDKGFAIVCQLYPASETYASYLTLYSYYYGSVGDISKSIVYQERSSELLAQLYGTESEQYKQAMTTLMRMRIQLGNVAPNLNVSRFSDIYIADIVCRYFNIAVR